jgi:hypothetical protein
MQEDEQLPQAIAVVDAAGGQAPRRNSRLQTPAGAPTPPPPPPPPPPSSPPQQQQPAKKHFKLSNLSDGVATEVPTTVEGFKLSWDKVFELLGSGQVGCGLSRSWLPRTLLCCAVPSG